MRPTICEVGPRDGLQNERDILPPQARAELIDRLSSTGVPAVEAVSFVKAAAVPQMADAERVLELVERADGVRYAGLALNARGCDRFLASPLDELHVAVAATDTFSLRNTNSTAAEATAFAIDSVRRVEAVGRRCVVTIAVAFGCPFEGTVDPGSVREIAARVVENGADEVSLADTIGLAAPREVSRLVGEVVKLGAPVGVHFHNTRNSGYANAVAALEAGAVTVDSSVGGIGGCPFAPGASGNIATEDIVYILERDGIDTGVDLDALVRTARWLEARLARPLPGMLHRLDAAAASA